MHTVDARGLLCPKPLIETKKVFKTLEPGEQMIILIDNDTSCSNVERFLADNGAQLSTSRDKDVYRIDVTKKDSTLSHPDEQAYCVPASRSHTHAICIKSDHMGIGDQELGDILMKAFLNTIKETEPLPQAITFYNRGIFLALKDAGSVESVKELEESGVKILVCGTCLDFYGQKKNLGVGIVSNMYDILQTLTDADKVIYP